MVNHQRKGCQGQQYILHDLHNYYSVLFLRLFKTMLLAEGKSTRMNNKIYDVYAQQKQHTHRQSQSRVLQHFCRSSMSNHQSNAVMPAKEGTNYETRQWIRWCNLQSLIRDQCLMLSSFDAYVFVGLSATHQFNIIYLSTNIQHIPKIKSKQIKPGLETYLNLLPDLVCLFFKSIQCEQFFALFIGKTTESAYFQTPYTNYSLIAHLDTWPLKEQDKILDLSFDIIVQLFRALLKFYSALKKMTMNLFYFKAQYLKVNEWLSWKINFLEAFYNYLSNFQTLLIIIFQIPNMYSLDCLSYQETYNLLMANSKSFREMCEVSKMITVEEYRCDMTHFSRNYLQYCDQRQAKASAREEDRQVSQEWLKDFEGLYPQVVSYYQSKNPVKQVQPQGNLQPKNYGKSENEALDANILTFRSELDNKQMTGGNTCEQVPVKRGRGRPRKNPALTLLNPQKQNLDPNSSKPKPKTKKILKQTNENFKPKRKYCKKQKNSSPSNEESKERKNSPEKEKVWPAKESLLESLAIQKKPQIKYMEEGNEISEEEQEFFIPLPIR